MRRLIPILLLLLAASCAAQDVQGRTLAPAAAGCSFSDNFPGTNGDALSASWSTAGFANQAPVIYGTAAGLTTAHSLSGAVVNTGIFTADQYAQATLVYSGSGDKGQLICVRMNSVTDGQAYCAGAQITGRTKIKQCDAGGVCSDLTMSPATGPISAENDVMGIQVVGQAITMRVNGSTWTATGTGPTAGAPGFGVGDLAGNSAIFDNFIGGCGTLP